MFREIKYQKIAEIDKFLNMFEQINHLREKQNDIRFKGTTSKALAKKYNFLEKHIFKRKEYKQSEQYRKEMEKEQEQQISEIQQLIDKISERITQEMSRRYGIISNVPDRDCFEEEKEKFQKATQLSDLGFEERKEKSVQVQAYEYLISKGKTDVKFESIDEGLQMFPEIARNNYEFMLNSLSQDPSNIKYDLTNDPRIYISYLNIQRMKLDVEQTNNPNNAQSYQQEINDIEKYIDEITNPKPVEPGKYKVPQKYLFEELRQKASGIKASGVNVVADYFKVDGKFSQEFGEEMEALYSDNADSVLAMHGTAVDEKTLQEITNNGLRESAQSNAERTVARTALTYPMLIFNSALDYAGAELCNGVVILKLPKGFDQEDSMQPVWGSDEPKGTNYILPQYVVGYYLERTDDGKENINGRRIIRGKPEDKKKYSYLHYDRLVDEKDYRCIDTEKENRIEEK